MREGREEGEGKGRERKGKEKMCVVIEEARK